MMKGKLRMSSLNAAAIKAVFRGRRPSTGVKRLHSTPGDMSPMAFEKKWLADESKRVA